MPNASSNALTLGSGIKGKHQFRIREIHLAQHLIPLMRSKALGAAKLDLVLRCTALLPAHAGKRADGTVLPAHSWAELHDVTRGVGFHGGRAPDLDPTAEELKAKRKWVGAQLARLEEMDLVRRESQAGDRPRLVVLRDDGSGKAFDDPGEARDPYVTVLGHIIASGALARWRTPELSAYLAAMVAERHDASVRRGRSRTAGAGPWFRPLAWFADLEQRYGNPGRVRLPFSVSTLERGFQALRDEGLITWTTISADPVTKRRFKRQRNLYRNRFDALAKASAAGRNSGS